MDLPRYKSPPINEVCCGMKFHPSDKLRVPHIGSLWEQFRADYPIIQHAPPLASVKGDILVDGTTGVPWYGRSCQHLPYQGLFPKQPLLWSPFGKLALHILFIWWVVSLFLCKRIYSPLPILFLPLPFGEQCHWIKVFSQLRCILANCSGTALAFHLYT